MATLNRYRLRITLSVNATSPEQAEAVVRFLLRTDKNQLTVEATEEPATPEGWAKIDADQELAPEPPQEPTSQQAVGHLEPARQTVSQGLATRTADRPYWLTYRFAPDQPSTASRTMYFSSPIARTAWIAGLGPNIAITGQGDDLG